MGARIFTRKSLFLLVITLWFIKEGVWSLYRFMFFDTLIAPSFLQFHPLWTLCMLTGYFQNRSLTHLRCSPWLFGLAVTLSVALPVEFFSSIFRIYIWTNGIFPLFYSFNFFSYPIPLLHLPLYQNWIAWEKWDPCFIICSSTNIQSFETFGLLK